MKFVKNNATIDAGAVAQTAENLKLPLKFAELLFSRGIDTEEKILKYLCPEKNAFCDPFGFNSMQTVVNRIRQAAENKEKVVVYCDYDADGVCAGAILSLFLSSLGTNVYTRVPNREGDGYGLSIEALDKIIEQHTPDLIITCDCGISCAVEVEHTLDLGVDIIVTDHHEVADRIPDCPILNPRMADCGYPFGHLSGSGVVYKLVCAYLGEEAAAEYLDLAAIATVADLVPLTDENRLLVQRGLKQLNMRSNIGLNRMLERLQLHEVTAADIAFKIAPRINAAGRMGDASRAYRLLISDNLEEIDAILDAIERDNELRKEMGETLYAEALEELRQEDLTNKRTIALSHPTWEKGITGILAARIAGDFKRPAFVMVKSGGHYKGTARSIDGVNIYEVLTSVGDLLIEFGGHSQAAGFSIKEENIPAFKQRTEDFVKKFDNELFLPAANYDIEIEEGDLTSRFVKALQRMEPLGKGNHAPLFLLKTGVKSVEPLKSNPAHTLVVTEGGLNLMAFGFLRKNQILTGKNDKELIIEAQTDITGGVRGLLRQARNEELYINDELAKAGFIKTFGFKNSKIVIQSEAKDPSLKKTNAVVKYDKDELEGIIGDNIYGTLIIAGREASFREFLSGSCADKAVLAEFIHATHKNNYTRLIVSPEVNDGLPLYLYDKVVFLDSPLGIVTDHIFALGVRHIFVPDVDNSGLFLDGIDLSRETFGRYYEAIRNYEATKNYSTPVVSFYAYFLALNKTTSLNLRQFSVVLSVFKELGLVEIVQDKGFCVIINKGVRAELENSVLYREILLYKGRG
ncbi:MAG: single-stranded-DNA-specific exonuclease RecJ [Firmicutes bacterium]|nr:single-stranded-DNA-specific exonuclease RecJ [Bacillota bacterium]